ncbi:AAA family ATPase [Croceicoccus marinus]|uniref:AAA+ ATPase domain-containing protein n=1 Tax=Croceicoccus marinus TaxID=450378 RepID=A0A217EYT5_9SPHN|nr:AAA family ATPase [Croceicoccus marinus]ARU18291.1 hypothetical protein A9D14_18215 [Croceicoccus marinus]
MKTAEYKAWLEAEGNLPNTVSTRISDARRIEKHFGDLDEAFREDKCARIFARLAYSKADEAAGLPNPSAIAVDGNVYDTLAHFRSTLNSYVKFRDSAHLGDSDILAKFDSNADFRAVRANWDEVTEASFCRIARAVHNAGLDWWFVDIAHTPVRFGRKFKGRSRAHSVIGYLRAADCEVALNARNDALQLVAQSPVDLSETGAPLLVSAIENNLEKLRQQFPIDPPRAGFWPNELEVEGEAEAAVSSSIYLVTALDGDVDGFDGFVKRGDWHLLYDNGGKYNQMVREMRSGDHIVLRDYLPGQRNAPFEQRGHPATAMRIRATGVVTQVSDDGLSVKVDWTPLTEPKLWWLYTNNDTIWRLPVEKKEAARRLAGFIYEDESQDLDWFRNHKYWRDRFGDSAAKVLSMAKPTNLILYGPPGTGKTYRTALEAVRLCDGDADDGDDDEGRAALMERYGELVKEKRIEFVTFHQNFGYEDFVEGLRPTTGSADGQTAGGFELKPEPGIFRRIADRAAAPVMKADAAFSLDDRSVFKLSLGEAGKAEWEWVFEDSLEEGYAIFGFKNVDWSDERFRDRDAILRELHERFPDEKLTVQNGDVKSPDRFRNRINEGDVVIVSKGLNAFRAIGVVEGSYEYAPRPDGRYCHRRKVRWLWDDPEGVDVREISEKRFSLDTVYEVPKSRLNITEIERLVNAAAASEVEDESAEREPHVLIIDEINRANISKVFGELITLLEPDKRLGQGNALTVRLPYSKREFGVPSNLHVIGTMNTADRSIAQIDTALRRRFKFEEIAPDPSLLTTADGISLRQVLTVINQRIEYLIDRDHRIGHAFFMGDGGKDRRAIDATMRDKVIPLLQEYFFEDWSRIASVVGDGFLEKTTLKAPPGIMGDPRDSWSVRGVFLTDAYDRLLEGSLPDESEEQPQYEEAAE